MVGDDGTLIQGVAEDFKNIWNEKAQRWLIVVSLALQIILSLLGNLRKKNPRTLIRITVWVGYLLTYAVVPVSLSLIAQTASSEVYIPSRLISKHHKSNTSEHMSFRDPFLLLHLGGPDSISAYSLVDNELWLRHLLSLVFQSGVALYIHLSSWTGSVSHLLLLSIFVYAAGFIKIFQQVQALRLGNVDHLRESMLDSDELAESSLAPDEPILGSDELEEWLNEPILDPDELEESLNEPILDPDELEESLNEPILDPDELEESLKEHLQEPILGPEYLQSVIVRESMLGLAENLQVLAPVLESMLGLDQEDAKPRDIIVEIDQEGAEPLVSNENQMKEILEAYDQFPILKRLLVDLVITEKDKDRSRSYFRHLNSALEAFGVVATELGFAYDMLYTKACVAYTCKGLILATRVFQLLLVLVRFHFFSNLDNYGVIDVAITYVLIGAEISKEIFAVITKLHSDWTDLWLNQHKYTRNHLIFSFVKQPSKQRWSNSIAQTDLLSVALVEKPASFLPLQKFFRVDEYLQNRRYETHIQISDNLKEMIHKHICDLASRSESSTLWIHKGSFSLQENECRSLLWSINEFEFDHSLLIWHIATALCYYSEVNVDDQFEINRIESKHISEYLVNLLISNPEMLPKGTGVIKYRDTCADAVRFFKTKDPITEKAEACRMLLEVDGKELLPSIVKGVRSKSVLCDGYKLALALREMEREPMWKVMSQVWMEMLLFAAASCRGVQHMQQLRKGGEFLSHVWLLMAHLGMTDHFQQQKESFPSTSIEMYEMTHDTEGSELNEAFLNLKASVKLLDKYRAAMIEKYGPDTSTHPVEDVEIWEHCAQGKIKTMPLSIVTRGEPNIVLTSLPVTLSAARSYASSISDEVQQLKEKLQRIEEEREAKIVELKKEKAEKAEMQERLKDFERMLNLLANI